MECPACTTANAADARFCRRCGAALAPTCAGCGRELQPDAAFCDRCGRPVGDDASAPGPLPASPTPGERRQATVLFSDLCGFTALTETLDPEEVEHLMRRLKDRAVAVVEAQGGIVSQFVGDEVLALFGVPAAHEDDPLRAVRAAQGLHALARELSPDVEDRAGRSLRMHSGIHTGLVVTSTADARDGTVGVTGDTVNTAARLKALAADDAVLLGPETARLVEAFVAVEALPAAALKGKAAPVSPWRVTGEAADRSRFEAAAARRGFTPFAGRERELATLRDCLDRATAGQGQFVTVIGEAGVGKSRLAYEFRRSIDRDAVTVLEGRCQSYGAETPYLPFLDALRRGLRIHELTEPAALHDTAVASIRAISPDLERFLPHLLHLLSIPSDDHRLPETLQGEALRRELEAALAAVITLNTRHRPMVLIYEDWHWADEASDAALNTLLGMVGHHPLLLLVLYRPEYERKWAELENYTALVLHSLDVAQTARMLGSVLGVETLPEGLAEAVHARTGGNALFNEELAHALREEGAVEIDQATARLTRSLDDLRLPDTIHAVIRARVDRLDPEDREVLRLASVIGREFDRAVLERIASSRQQVSAALERLARQDLVHQVRVVPAAEYLFKHVLTQEVVYETLLLSQRKQLHAAVGAAIETLYADRLEEHVEALAEHYRLSEETEKAIDYLEKAAGKALGAYSMGVARSALFGACALIEAGERSQPHMRRHMAVAYRLATISVGGPTPELADTLRKAVEFGDSTGDIVMKERLEGHLGSTLGLLGLLNEALEYSEAVVARLRSGDDEAIGMANFALGFASLWAGRFRASADILSKAIPRLQAAQSRFFEGWALNNLGLAYAMTGARTEAKQAFEGVIELARGTGIRILEPWGVFWSGVTYLFWGEWQEGELRSAKGADLANELGDPFTAAWANFNASRGRFMAGMSGAGLDGIRAVVRALESLGTMIAMSYAYGYLAEYSAIAGNLGESRQAVRNALACKDRGDDFAEALTYRCAAVSIACDQDPDWGRVEEMLRNSEHSARERGILVELPVTHFRFAECLHKMGDLDAATEQLDQAEALFREMGMDWWTEQAEGLRGRLERGEPFVWFAPYVDGPPKVDA